MGVVVYVVVVSVEMVSGDRVGGSVGGRKGRDFTR